VAHEHGHVEDARDNTKQFFEDGRKTQNAKGCPNAQPHNDRPEEKRADKFKDRVERDVKETKRQAKQRNKEENERRKREERERKKEENQ
jgi:hypothetical protein